MKLIVGLILSTFALSAFADNLTPNARALATARGNVTRALTEQRKATTPEAKAAAEAKLAKAKEALMALVMPPPPSEAPGETSATAELSGIPRAWFTWANLGDAFGEPTPHLPTSYRVLRVETTGEDREATGTLKDWLQKTGSQDLSIFGDADRDGLVNLVEWACGASSPVVVDGNIVSTFPQITAKGKAISDTQMFLQYQVAVPAVENVKYVVEVGDGRSFRAGVLGTDYEQTADYGFVKVVRNLHKMATEPALAFIRLRVVLTP